MNEYIKNRIELEKLAIQEKCTAEHLDEKYAGGLWDWAGDIVKPINHEGYEHLAEEIQSEIYYALQETFETLNRL